MFPSLAVFVLALTIGSERTPAPPRIGVPPTWDTVTHVIPNAGGFLAVYRADGQRLAVQIDRDGNPAGEGPRPSRIGDAISIGDASVATDGDRILTSHFGPTRIVIPFALQRDFSLELLDETSSEAEVTIPIADDVILAGPILWTGHDYVAMYVTRTNTLRMLRVSADGTVTYGPADVADDVATQPVAVFDGRDVLIAVRTACTSPSTCDHVRVIRVTSQNDIAVLQDMRPSNPTNIDFAFGGGSAFLLIGESIPGTVVDNVYRIDDSGGLQLAESLPLVPDTIDLVRMVSSGDRVLLYHAKDRRIEAKPVGAPVWKPILDLRNIDSWPPAASGNGIIVFVWSESLIASVYAPDPVFATIDAALANARADGKPDGVLLTRGASYRANPAVAVAGDTTLIAWLETLEGESWIAGSLVAKDGTTTPIEISAHDADGRPKIASDGSSFLVTWTVPAATDSAIRARVVRPGGTMSEIRPITPDNSALPDVAWNAGAYVLVWQDPSQDDPYYYPGLGTRIFARRFDAAGLPIDSSPRLIAAGSQPAIASDGKGLLVAWTSGAICTKADCRLLTFLDVHGRVFDAQLNPVSNDFAIANDNGANESAPVIASSGTGWLVAWTARREEFRSFGSAFTFVPFADVGHAVISPNGTIVAAGRPPLTNEAELKQAGAVSWTGREYIVASVGNALQLTSIGSTGVTDGEIAIDGSSPALAGTVLTYARSAAEQGIGAAPQVFFREITSALPPRRRAVVR